MEAIYKRNDIVVPNFDHVEKCARISALLPRMFFYSYCGMVIGLMIHPFINSYIVGELRSSTAQQIMGVDSSTTYGFIITTVWGIIQCIIFIPLSTFTDFMYPVYAYNVQLFSGLIRRQMDQLNNLLVDKTKSKDILCIKITLRNIVQMHIEMNE